MTEQGNEKPSIAGLARVRLGHSQLTVRPVGLGCMGMSQFYGAADDNESINTLREAIDLGANFLDTSDIYGAADIGLAQPNAEWTDAFIAIPQSDAAGSRARHRGQDRS